MGRIILAASALCLALLLGLSGLARAADPASRTDTLLASLVGERDPGLAVGVWRAGKVAYKGVRGWADLEQKVPITSRTVFHLASLSKQFTGFVIAQLASEGRLDLTADVRTYLPELPEFGPKITVLDLLHHTSGLKDQWTMLALSGHDMRDVLTQHEILQIVKRTPELDFAPGTAYTYSNTDYTLLAEIASKVAGRRFADLVAERVFQPVGMHDSFIYDDVTKIVPHRANSYDRDEKDGTWRRALLEYDNYGATSAHSTLDDMLTWGIALGHRRFDGKALFEALTPPFHLKNGDPIAYGYGLVRDHLLGRRAIIHIGSDAGFRTAILYFPDDDLGVIVLANRVVNAREIALKLAGLWLADESPPPPAQSAPPPPRDIAGLYAGGPSDALVSIVAASGGMQIRRGVEAVPDEPVWSLLPTRDGFRLADHRVSCRVDRGPNGAVRGLWEYDEDESREQPTTTYLRRLAPWSPTPAELAEFVGSYRSAALDVGYEIAIENGRLVLRHPARPIKAILYPATSDRFESSDWPFRTVEFVRNKGGVVALLVSDDRAVNVKFAKQPAASPQLERRSKVQ